MAVLKPRERLVYFRISEDEFHQFVSVCEQEGARSVSDLARNAVQRLIADGNRLREQREIAPKMETLEKLIAELSNQLRYLSTLLQRERARAAGSYDGDESGRRAAVEAQESQLNAKD